MNEVAPHEYVPSPMHMGDCAVCGHMQGADIHITVTPGAMKEALRLGQDLAARLAAAELEARRLRASVWEAMRLLQTGRVNRALEALKAAAQRRTKDHDDRDSD